MDIFLVRKQKIKDGIFGVLSEKDGTHLFFTLEHAFSDASSFEALIPVGTYTCKRSMHRLPGMEEDFETFQLENVPGHSGILFHWGNYNRDSRGCILLGLHIHQDIHEVMITYSRLAFEKFMESQKGRQEFKLTISD